MNRTVLQRLLATLRRWQDRRLALHALSGLDDRLLRDIGIDRNQVVHVVENHFDATASDPERPIRVTHPAETPRPYPARPAGIHGPAARHWPQAFRDAAGANDEAEPAASTPNGAVCRSG